MVIIKDKFIVIINYFTKFKFAKYLIINYFLINCDNHL